MPLLPSLWAYSRFTDADMCNSHGLTGYSLISTKWRETIWIPKSEAEGRSRPFCVFLSGMFSAILPFLSLQNRKSPLGPPRPSPELSRHITTSKLEHAQQPSSRTHLQPKVLTRVQIHFWFSEVRRDLPSEILYIYINAASCMTCLTLTTNNSIRHSSSWVTDGKAETEATLGVQHRGASASSLSFP